MKSKRSTSRKVILFRVGLLLFFLAVAVIGSALNLVRQDRLVIEPADSPNATVAGDWSVRLQEATIYVEETDAAFFRAKLDADYLPGGMKFFHWNPKGHAAKARLPRAYLKSQGLLSVDGWRTQDEAATKQEERSGETRSSAIEASHFPNTATFGGLA